MIEGRIRCETNIFYQFGFVPERSATEVRTTLHIVLLIKEL